MDNIIEGFLGRIELGEMQTHENMAVVALFAPNANGPTYVTLEEALAGGAFAVAELSQGGSVPALKVSNKGHEQVLLLDGEELKGAKQNRVLNTTILIAAHSETVVPVSCTEHGRWHYTSRAFASSDVVMSPSLRERKVRAVSQSLSEGRRFRGDQGEVWEGVAEQSARAQAHSPSGAMRDVFEARRGDLAGYLEALQLVEGQQGLLVCVNGRVVAFDILSRAAAYARLHSKLVSSYAMDALLSPAGSGQAPGDAEAAREFIAEVAACSDEVHESVGLGLDHRCTGARIVGSALVHDEAVVHAAFFRAEEGRPEDGLANASRRRGFRTPH